MNLAAQQLAQNKNGATHCKDIELHDHNIRVPTISNAWYVMVSLLARESCQLFLDMPDWRVMNRLLKKTHAFAVSP